MSLNLTEKASRMYQMLHAAHKIATVVHTHPDGDAVGSSRAVACWLESLGKDVMNIYPDPVPDTLGFMTSRERRRKCLVYSEQKEAADAWLRGCDLVFVLDMNSFSRAAGAENILKEIEAPKILIDHHLNPEEEQFCLVISEPEISSASELVFWLLQELAVKGGKGSIGPEAADAMMTGMTTDTNNFSNSTGPSTLEMASKLLEMGVDRDRIIDQLFHSYRENRLRAMGMMLESRMKITPEGVAYMIFFKQDFEKFQLDDGETEGFVNLPLAIGNVKMSLFLKEDNGHFRVSIRSKKGVSAARLANTKFHGGGHENAAGGKLFFKEDIAGPEEASAYIEKAIKDFFG